MPQLRRGTRARAAQQFVRLEVCRSGPVAWPVWPAWHLCLRHDVLLLQDHAVLRHVEVPAQRAVLGADLQLIGQVSAVVIVVSMAFW